MTSTAAGDLEGQGPGLALRVLAPVRSGSRTLFYEPDGPGFVRLTVMDAKGAAADRVLVRVQ